MELKDSKTFKNLATAFAAECQARARYEFVEYGFRYNGYEAIAQTIDIIAYQEFNHARMLYTYLQDAELKQIDNIEIRGGFPFKQKWDMEENLRLVAQDEEDEAKAYAEYIKVAKDEGFNDIAELFKMIMEVEIRHKEIFLEIYNQFKMALYTKKKQRLFGIVLLVGIIARVKRLGKNVHCVKLRKAFAIWFYLRAI